MDIKKYCRKCGKEMIATSSIDHYDINTGKPVIIYYWECPDKTWYAHSSFTTDENGNLSCIDYW